MIFAISFVGNALFLSIPLLLFLLLFCSVLLFKQSNAINLNNINTFLLILFCLFFFFSKNIFEIRVYDPYYFLWPVYALIFIIFCSKHDIFSNFNIPFLLVFLISIFFLWGASSFQDETGRAYFIFGANVLYRLFLFLSFLVLLNTNNFLLKLFFLLIGFFGVYLTGSRMGLLLAVILYSIYFFTPYNNGKFSEKKLVRILILIPSLLALVLLNLNQLSALYELSIGSEGMISRLLTLSGGSISIRLYFLTTFLNYFSLFGSSVSIFEFFYFKSYFPYPHNIIAELVFYYGFFGVLISLIIIFEFLKTFKNFVLRKKMSIIEIAFLVIFPSTLASGDIVDGMLVIFYSLSNFLIWHSNKYLAKVSSRKTILSE